MGLYQSILRNGAVPVDDSPEQIELRLSGLVVQTKGCLKVYNQIYASVFNLHWVEKMLNNLRPYSEVFTAWVASNYQDESRLLRGNALQEKAEGRGQMAEGKIPVRNARSGFKAQ